MTSAPVCDPLADHLLMPQNAALLLIDCQPSPLAGVHTMDRARLVKITVSKTGQRGGDGGVPATIAGRESGGSSVGVEGRSVADISARLRIPEGTVKSRLHYGLRTLRLVLQKKGVTRP